MASKKKKSMNSSSSSSNYEDALITSFDQSTSSATGSSSGSSFPSGSSSNNSEKLNSSSSSSHTLDRIGNAIIIYYDRNRNKVTLENNKQVYYFDKDVNFYDNKKNQLNYKVIDIITPTKDEPMKIIINIEPDLDPTFSSISSDYGKYKSIHENAKITYYDENDNEITPPPSEKVLFFSVDSGDSNNYSYYNINRRKLDYETINFNYRKEIKLRIKRKSSHHSPLPAVILNPHHFSPVSIKSYKTFSSKSKSSSLTRWNYDTDYKDENFNDFIPASNEIIRFYDTNYKYYNENREELNYSVSPVRNHADKFIARLRPQKQPVKSPSPLLLQPIVTPSHSFHSAAASSSPKRRTHSSHSFHSAAASSPKKRSHSSHSFHSAAASSSPKRRRSNSFSPPFLQPITSSKSPSLKPWSYTTDYRDQNNQSYMPKISGIISYYNKKDKSFHNSEGYKLYYNVYPDPKISGAYIAELPQKPKTRSLKYWTYATDYINADNIRFAPLRDNVIAYYDTRHFYNIKEQILNYDVYEDPNVENGYIARLKRKISKLSDKTFTPSSSSSSVSVNEEKIKLCSKWAFNKRKNPERPKNPKTNRIISVTGKIYKDLNKKCRKIQVLSNAMKSSSTSSADVDSHTFKTCAKWANIKEKYPTKPYNPDNKKKTPIKVKGPTYNKLEKMCKKVKINDYKLSSSSKSSMIEDADSETIKRCNKWAAIKNKHPDNPYNPDNKKKTIIKVGGPTYKKLEKECRKIRINSKYKMEETPINSKDKIDSIKLMKQCDAFKKLEEKFRNNPKDKELRKKLKEFKAKLLELKEKCPRINKKATAAKKDVEKIILNEDDRYLCMQWSKIKLDYPNNLYNPITKAQINRDGPTYKKLEKKCKDFNIRDSDIRDVNVANPKKNLEKKVLNKALCLEWRDTRDVNPLTNKFIQKDGKTYKDIKRQCKEIMKKQK